MTLHDNGDGTVSGHFTVPTLAGAILGKIIDQLASPRRGRLIPTVLAGASQPLDLCRTSRFFTEAQRVAAALHHDTCTAHGCDTPYAWTELHHRDPWAQGGSTDLTEMVPLCSFHHQHIHDPAYHHHDQPDGTITFTRRT